MSSYSKAVGTQNTYYTKQKLTMKMYLYCDFTHAACYHLHVLVLTTLCTIDQEENLKLLFSWPIMVHPAQDSKRQG